MVDFDPSAGEDLQASFGQYDFFISHFNWQVLTGILEQENDVNITLFPNPTQDFIELSGILNAEVRIYNTAGQVVLTNSGSKRINVSSLKPGQYILVAENGHEHAHKVFIKQ